jgi:hypothetical protein
MCQNRINENRGADGISTESDVAISSYLSGTAVNKLGRAKSR